MRLALVLLPASPPPPSFPLPELRGDCEGYNRIDVDDDDDATVVGRTDADVGDAFTTPSADSVFSLRLNTGTRAGGGGGGSDGFVLLLLPTSSPCACPCRYPGLRDREPVVAPPPLIPAALALPTSLPSSRPTNCRLRRL